VINLYIWVTWSHACDQPIHMGHVVKCAFKIPQYREGYQLVSCIHMHSHACDQHIHMGHVIKCAFKIPQHRVRVIN
jgi:hypothetical protein